MKANVSTALECGYPNAARLASALNPTPGRVQYRLGSTGNGKSSDYRVLVRTLAKAGVVVASAGDEPQDVARVMNVPAGLAGNIRIHRATNFEGLLRSVYKAVRTAVSRNEPFPVAVVVDDAHCLRPRHEWPLTVTFLATLAQFDLAEAGRIGGLTYEAWCGEPAPDTSNSTMAVVAYYTQLENSPELIDTVKLLRFEEVDSVIELKRAQPQRNPVVDGHLSNTDGTFTVWSKNENPTVIEMCFDVQPDGFRCRWYDI